MFKYVYHLECGKTSKTCRWTEKTWFTKYNLEADEVLNGISEILEEIKNNWYYDSYLTTFTITRSLVSEHFHWHDKVIFKWVNPDLKYN